MINNYLIFIGNNNLFFGLVYNDSKINSIYFGLEKFLVTG